MKFINSQIYTKQEYFLDSDDPQFSSQRPNEIKFNNIGHIKLDRRMLSTRVTGPSMLHADVASPLDGILALNMKYFVDESIGQVQRSERPAMNRTFVSVYRMVDGYASWTRFWCVLDQSLLYFYQNPEDEKKKVRIISKCLVSLLGIKPCLYLYHCH